MMIHFGIDNLLEQDPTWKKQRIGLVTNHAATTRQLVSSRKALLDHGFNLVRLFSPEHGLDVTGADGAPMKDGIDSLTGLPVISLYGEKQQPTAEDLADIDLLLFDIPDIGCRFYTYLWTLTHVLEACGKLRKKIIVLDRPNPISGNLTMAEGPGLDETNCSSFIGRWNIPVRHSCTLSELALYFNQSRQLQAPLDIIKCSGWDRNSFQPDWGIPFVATSPAIQSFEAMVLYPGLAMLEATNISEGRGSAYSFLTAGAPWIQAEALTAIVNQLLAEDLNAVPVKFTPQSGKFTGQLCQGIQLQVLDQLHYHPVMTGLLLIRLIRQVYPAQFAWKPYPTSVNPSGKQHLDKLTGIAHSEELFELPIQQFLSRLQQLTKATEWQKTIQPYLLY